MISSRRHHYVMQLSVEQEGVTEALILRHITGYPHHFEKALVHVFYLIFYSLIYSFIYYLSVVIVLHFIYSLDEEHGHRNLYLSL